MLKLLIVLCLLSFLVAIVCLPVRRIRRRAQWIALATVIGWIIAFSIFLHNENNKSRGLGFVDAADQSAAEASGFTDPTAWRTDRQAKKQAELAATAKKEADEAAAAAAKKEADEAAAAKKEADEAAASAKKEADEIAAKAALDHSAATIQSCDGLALAPIMEGIQTVSWSQGSRICENVQRSLAGSVSVGVFRNILKAATVVKFTGGGGGDIVQIAHQIAEIIDARGQNNADLKKIESTIDIVVKAYNGSNHRVTPRDLNVALRQSGKGKRLDDEGVFTLAAMISIQKRNNGE